MAGMIQQVKGFFDRDVDQLLEGNRHDLAKAESDDGEVVAAQAAAWALPANKPKMQLRRRQPNKIQKLHGYQCSGEAKKPQISANGKEGGVPQSSRPA